MSTPAEVWLALRQDGAVGDGSAANPFDASSPTLFDTLMRSFQTSTRVIHLGPGIFQTRGYNEWYPSSPLGWSALISQRIIGAGMFQTTQCA